MIEVPLTRRYILVYQSSNYIMSLITLLQNHEKGSIMNYILSVESKLGSLTFLRVWHDNSGFSKDRSWFLDQIEVTDLQTGERLVYLQTILCLTSKEMNDVFR